MSDTPEYMPKDIHQDPFELDGEIGFDVINPSEELLTDKQKAQDLAGSFLESNKFLIESLVGLRGLSIEVGTGFRTNMETGKVTVDPSFFVEQGYRPEWCMYGTLHELRAHLKEFINHPRLTEEKNKFFVKSKAHGIFVNILDDITGNNGVHKILPSMEEVARDVYSERLFVPTDYTSSPLHLQFLYGLIRREMVPQEDVTIDPMVEEAIDRLRHYGKNKQDALAFVFNPFTKPDQRWKVMERIIWPEYDALLQEDKTRRKSKGDQNRQPKGDDEGAPDENNQGPSDDENSGGNNESPPDEGNNEGNNPNPSEDDNKEGSDDFGDDYKDYWDGHAEPFTEEDAEDLKTLIQIMINNGEVSVIDKNSELGEGSGKGDGDRKGQHSEKKGGGSESGSSVDGGAIKMMEAEAGVGYSVILEYRNKLDELWPIIEDLEEFYEALLTERAALYFSKLRNRPEGELDDGMLADIVANVLSHQEVGDVYTDITESRAETIAHGGFNYFLLLDTSSSMDGEKAETVRDVAVALIEGLDSCHQKVLEKEEEFGFDSSLDVSTSVILFDNDLRILKPIGDTLTEKERMKVFQQTTLTKGWTHDYKALEQVKKNIEELRKSGVDTNRLNVIIVVTDGYSSNSSRCTLAVQALRDMENTIVIGVGVEDEGAAEEQYEPHGQSLPSVDDLAATMIDIVKHQIRDTQF